MYYNLREAEFFTQPLFFYFETGLDFTVYPC